YLPYLKELVQKNELADRVHFRPFSKETPLAFAALDVFVMASLSEPFGMVTIEALATARPVIGTNSGGTRELLNYGQAGLLFSPKNADELKEAVKILYQDASQREKLREQGEAWARENYSHIKQCEQVEELLKELAK
ncbi:MAG: glycosyltransferase family 4 protein, partial [Bacteroidota bacterium]